MNITIFIGGLSGGGAERVVCNLANYLTCRKHNVTILTMSKTDHYTLSKNIQVIALLDSKERKNIIIDNLKRYFRLRSYICRLDTQCYLVMLPITACLLLHMKRLSKAPIVYAERSDPNAYRSTIKLLLKHFLPKVDGAVYQTIDASLYYTDVIKASSVVIPNAINPEFIRERTINERTKTIVAVGRLKKCKNIQMLIHAFARILPNHPGYKLIIYGQGPQLEELQTLAVTLGIGDDIAFLGYMDRIEDHIANAGLFVLPSYYEGMPNSLMEAMALGLPCISTDCPCGGPRYLIHHGENGLLVPVGDETALAEALETVLNDEAFARTLGQNARSIVKKLDSKIIYGQWEAFINEIVGLPRK